MLYKQENELMSKYGIEKMEGDDWRYLFDGMSYQAPKIILKYIGENKLNLFMIDLYKHQDKLNRFYKAYYELSEILDYQEGNEGRDCMALFDYLHEL